MRSSKLTRGVSAIGGRPFRAWVLALTLANPFVASVLLAAPASSRFGHEAKSQNKESVSIYDERGSVVKTIPLENETAVFGAGEHFALVSAQSVARERAVEIRDAGGARVAEFDIPADRAVAIGHGRIALTPKAEHAPGTRFELEIRDLNGDRLGSHAEADLILVGGAQLHANGHCTTVAIDRERGQRVVHHFGPDGQLRWVFRSSGDAMPVVGISPSGAQAVIGIIQPDLRSSTLHRLDSAGQVTHSATVPAFIQALFSPDERHLLLAGQDALQLMNAPDGSVRWSSREEVLLAPGGPIAFSADGSRFYVVSQQRDARGRPAEGWLRVYSTIEGAIVRTDRRLDAVPPGTAFGVLELGERADRTVKVTTTRGIWLVAP